MDIIDDEIAAKKDLDLINETRIIEMVEDHVSSTTNNDVCSNTSVHADDIEEDDVPPDFFDDFSNKDFLAGLDVVDAWDDVDVDKDETSTNLLAHNVDDISVDSEVVEEKKVSVKNRLGVKPDAIDNIDVFKSKVSIKSRLGKRGSGSISQSQSERHLKQTKFTHTFEKKKIMEKKQPKPQSKYAEDMESTLTDKTKVPLKRGEIIPFKDLMFSRDTRERHREKSSERYREKSSERHREKSSERMAKLKEERRIDDLESRRDPTKTKRDIQRDKMKCAKDKEAKIISEKLRVVETGLVPPGMEMEFCLDDINLQITMSAEEQERKNKSIQSSDKKRSHSLEHKNDRTRSSSANALTESRTIKKFKSSTKLPPSWRPDHRRISPDSRLRDRRSPLTIKWPSAMKTKSPSPKRRLSPPYRRSSPPRRSSPSNRRNSPLNRRSSPLNRKTSPLNRRTSPSNRRTSPSNRRTSLSNRRTSPSNRRTSPSNRRPSPPNRRPSPPNRRSSPPNRRLSPSNRRSSQTKRRFSRSPRKSRSPGRYTSRNESHKRRQSPIFVRERSLERRLVSTDEIIERRYAKSPRRSRESQVSDRELWIRGKDRSRSHISKDGSPSRKRSQQSFLEELDQKLNLKAEHSKLKEIQNKINGAPSVHEILSKYAPNYAPSHTPVHMNPVNPMHMNPINPMLMNQPNLMHMNPPNHIHINQPHHMLPVNQTNPMHNILQQPPPPYQTPSQLYDQKFFIGQPETPFNPLPVGPPPMHKSMNIKIPQQNFDQHSMDPESVQKLFEDEKITLSNFLSITTRVSDYSKPIDIISKVNVIKRCQDAIQIISENTKPNGRFLYKKLMKTADRSVEVPNQSPLKKVPSIRFHFTTKARQADEKNKTALKSLLQKLGLREPVPIQPCKESPTGMDTFTSPFRGRDTTSMNVLMKMTQTDPIKCNDCEKRNGIVFSDASTQCEVSVSDFGAQVIEDDFLNTARSALKNILKNQSLATLTSAQILAQLVPKEEKKETFPAARKMDPPTPAVQVPPLMKRPNQGISNNDSFPGASWEDWDRNRDRARFANPGIERDDNRFHNDYNARDYPDNFDGPENYEGGNNYRGPQNFINPSFDENNFNRPNFGGQANRANMPPAGDRGNLFCNPPNKNFGGRRF